MYSEEDVRSIRDADRNDVRILLFEKFEVGIGFADYRGEVLNRATGLNEGLLADGIHMVGLHILVGGGGEGDNVVADFGAHMGHVDANAPFLKQVENEERNEDDGDDDADFPGGGRLAVERVLPGQAGAIEVNRGMRLGGVGVIHAVVIGGHERMMGAAGRDGKPAKKGRNARVFFG